MAKNPFFKAQAQSEWIVLSLIHVDDVPTKAAKEKLNIEIIGGRQPKNIMEIEKNKQEQNLTYADMPEKFKATWDQHPMQGIIVALGPKVDPVENLKVGDKVYFRSGTGEPMIYNKEFYLLIKVYDIYVKVPN